MNDSPINAVKGRFVLLGFAEALSSPEVTWSLVDAGFRVVAFSRKGRKSALRRSRYVKIFEVTPPEVDLAAARDDLSSVLRQCQRDSGSNPTVLFPLDDAAVWLCSEKPLPANCVLAGPLGDGARFALDKTLQIGTASQAGLLVPLTSVAQSIGEVLAREGELPLILKPAQAVIADRDSLEKGDNWICANRQELNSALTKWHQRYPLIVQPYISGAGIGVFGFSSGGRVGCWSAHRRLRMMNPHGSGSSACVSKAVPETLKGPIERMVKENEWRGLFMVEFLQDDAGQYWFIEFNGRPWGSMALSRRQGFEYPAWNAELALNSSFSIQRSESTDSEVVCRNAGRELMHLLFVLRGRKSQAIRRWPSFWRAAVEVLRVRRRDYFYNFRRDDWHVFFSDLICTIRSQIFKSRKGEQKT